MPCFVSKRNIIISLSHYQRSGSRSKLELYKTKDKTPVKKSGQFRVEYVRKFHCLALNGRHFPFAKCAKWQAHYICQQFPDS